MARRQGTRAGTRPPGLAESQVAGSRVRTRLTEARPSPTEHKAQDAPEARTGGLDATRTVPNLPRRSGLGQLVERSAKSVAFRVPGPVPWVVEHVCGLEPDEAAVRAGEWERFAPPVHGPAPDRMVERDPFVPAVPVLMAAERAGHARSPTPQEVEDWLFRRHSRRQRSASAECRGRPDLVVPKRFDREQELWHGDGAEANRAAAGRLRPTLLKTSKPVRCGSPTLGRFDSGAAPSQGSRGFMRDRGRVGQRKGRLRGTARIRLKPPERGSYWRATGAHLAPTVTPERPPRGYRSSSAPASCSEPGNRCPYRSSEISTDE